jgi:hypothetical protein
MVLELVALLVAADGQDTGKPSGCATNNHNVEK